MKIMAYILLAMSVTPTRTDKPGADILCGTSPCIVDTLPKDILANNPIRKSCSICNVSTSDFYCRKSTRAASSASVSNMDFLLQAASGVNKKGDCYQCDSAGSIWTGPLNCSGTVAGGIMTVTSNQ